MISIFPSSHSPFFYFLIRWFCVKTKKKLVEDVKIFFSKKLFFSFLCFHRIQLNRENVNNFTMYLFVSHLPTRHDFSSQPFEIEIKNDEIFLCRYKSHKEKKSENCERLHENFFYAFLPSGWIFHRFGRFLKTIKFSQVKFHRFSEISNFFSFLFPNHKYKQQ